MISDYLFAFGPVAVVFMLQILCCFLVRNKIMRHLPLLICVLFLVMMVISAFHSESSEDWSFLQSLFHTYLIEGIVGYVVAWLIYGTVVFFKKRKTADNRE